MKSPAAPPPQERSSAASKKGGFRALLWKLRHPFSRDFKRRIAYFPVLGPIVRYLYWCAMLPHRVNKIHDYIRDVLRILARHGRPGGAGGAAPGAPPPSAASAAWAAVNWANLPPDEVRKLMDQRFAAGEAYNRMYLWDELRNEELTDTFRNTFLRGRDPARMSILDIGCGLGGLAEQIRECREFVGIDVSEVAVHDAIRRYGSRPNYRFLRMDATKLEFPDGRFDAVAAREVLEHLPKPEQCLAEAFRVLKRGGVLILSSPNRDSLHLRVNRLLGNEDFKCSYDHIREFGYDEMRGMLDRAGFRIRHGAGVFLMPYWGIPGVDDPVRPFTDESPEMLDVLRQLGRRAGPEYAFIYVLEAEKPK
jgi:2-polyprenyl-3-methyl-5-hydroxy-6-metoxy-1,4-benzoquinol methylase